MLDVLGAKPKTSARYAGFSINQRGAAVEVNIDNIDTARVVFLKHAPRRYPPMVSLLRSAFRRPVLIISDGEDWRRTHDAVMPFLLARPVERDYAPVIRAVADEAFAELARRAAGSGLEIDVERQMRGITTRMLGHVLFGQVLTADEADFVEQTLDVATRTPRGRICAAINVVVGVVYRALDAERSQPLAIPPIQRRALDRLLAWIGRKIDAAGEDAPLLTSLKDRYAALGPALGRKSVIAEYAMMFVAGIETTAAALTFAVAEIAHDPAIQAQVAAEARRRPAPDSEGERTAAHHPYIFSVVQETLRRHTIVPTMLREAAVDHQITGKRPGAEPAPVTVRKGAVLRYLPVLNHMRRSLWKDPYRFQPERHGETLTRDQRKCHHPFGMGPQSCPGRSLATTEAVLILRALFARLDIAHRPITEAIPTERNAVFTIRPVGVTVRVTAADAAPRPAGEGSIRPNPTPR